MCAGDEKAGTCEASKPSREAGSQAHRAGEGRLVTESPRAHNDPRGDLNGLRVEYHCVCAGDEKAGTCEASKPSREAGSQAHRAGEGRLVTESPRAHKTTSKASVFCVARTSKLLCLCERLERIFYVEQSETRKSPGYVVAESLHFYIF